MSFSFLLDAMPYRPLLVLLGEREITLFAENISSLCSVVHCLLLVVYYTLCNVVHCLLLVATDVFASWLKRESEGERETIFGDFSVRGLAEFSAVKRVFIPTFLLPG